MDTERLIERWMIGSVFQEVLRRFLMDSLNGPSTEKTDFDR